MKKIVLTTCTVILCYCMSCNSKDSDNKISEAAQKNLDAVHAINNDVISGDVSNLGDYIATDAIDHAGEKGDVKGLDSIKAELGVIHSMYSNMKMEPIKELADDEYVFEWSHFSAVCTVAQMGMPAGSMMDMSSVHITKFKDGKAVEHWEFMQPADMMNMMPHENMDHMMMDTIKMKM
ncbi:MAG: ester cyclase [Bacteroidia bacterium]|nr:ester cyclase [Bacteroidia bacterium]